MIEMADITRVYGEGEGAVHALRGVTATIERGEFTAIIGQSGSGKSTLLNIIGALDQPTAGTVTIDGKNVGAMNDAQRTRFRRTTIGFVFQSFNLLPTLTAVENVSLSAELAGRGGTKARDRAETLLDRVGLGARKHHRPTELSGGEMQRVAIARALMMEPPLVVADEPTGNLDSETSEEILELLCSAVGDERTLVLVTHDPGIAARANRVLTMKDGRMTEGQTPASVPPPGGASASSTEAIADAETRRGTAEGEATDHDPTDHDPEESA